MRFEDREVHSLVQSYERALENDRQPYYDVEDLELGGQCVTDRYGLDKADQADEHGCRPKFFCQ